MKFVRRCWQGVLLTAALGGATTARADQAPGARAVSLHEALGYARAHQPSVRAALARIAAAQAAADVPRAQWLPQIGATAQIFLGSYNNTTASNVGSPYVDIPRIGGSSVVNASTSSFQPFGSTFAAVGIGQEVFDFGRIAAQSAAADALVEATKHGSDATRLDVELGVEESFYAVLTAKEVLKASEEAYARALVHRDQARAGVTAQLRPPIELTRAEAELALFDIGRIHARGGVTASQAVLAASTGVDDLTLDANGTLPGAGDVPTLSLALEQASARDPRVAEAVAKVRAQEARTKAIYAQLRPDLSATATFSGRAGGATPSSGAANSADYYGWLPTVPNWDVGLVFSWPIYDGTVVARAHASDAEAQALREEVSALKQVLTAKVQQAYIGVQVARDAIAGLQRQLDAAVANYAQADARYGAGLGTAVELADAEALRAHAEIEMARGKFELARARAALGRAIAEGLSK